MKPLLLHILLMFPFVVYAIVTDFMGKKIAQADRDTKDYIARQRKKAGL